MSDEFGIFNQEGLLEGEFYSVEEALAALQLRYAEEDDVHVGKVCHEHPEHEADTCELCNEE